MPEPQLDFWKKLAALTAFVSALAGVGALVVKYFEVARPASQSTAGATPAQSLKSRSLTGAYHGTLVNTSIGQGGRLQIQLLDTTGTLSGHVIITDGLEGSGELRGSTDGQTLNFVSTEPSTGITFAWLGNVSGSTLSGTYVVSFPIALRAARPDLGDERGTWNVSK